jgi:sulfoxide reductase heme-binding subunit YedZ
MNAETWWFLCRASGIVAWLMLTASVLWGVVLSTDLFPRRRRVAWLLDLHRWLGGLTVFFIAGHVAAVLLDRNAHFRAVDVVVPYASAWRPTAIAAGVVALWFLIAVEGTALAMKRLSRKWWRDVHILSYSVFWLATLHAALAGADSSKPLYVVTSLAAVSVVVFAASYRILTHGLPKRRPAPAQRTRDLVA